VDIASHEHIIELCDTYAMRLFLVWMVTKYGCNLSSSSIETGIPDAVPAPERFLQSFDIYPFAQAIELKNYSELADEASAFLDAAFHPSIELAGSLYEHLTSHELELSAEKPKRSDASAPKRKNFIAHIRTSVDGKYGRRKKGQFYTPPWVVDYCLENTLGKDLAELMKRLQQPKDISFSILDPACGTGNFLLGIIRNLRSIGATPSQIYTAACETIHGRDVDGRAVAIAIWSVAFSAYHAAGNETPGLDFARLVKCLRTNLRMTDSVFDSFSAKTSSSSISEKIAGGSAGVNSKRDSVGVKTADKTVFVENALDSFNAKRNGDSAALNNETESDRFDLVITNPPYISYGSRNQEKLLGSTSAFLRHHFPSSAEYKIRLNSIFQEVALNYVADGGKICLFIPNSFLTGKGYARLRANLLNKTRILSLSEFPEDTMKGAVVGRWCAAIYQRDDAAAGGELNYPIELVKFSCPVSGAKNASVVKTQYKIKASRLVTKDQSRFRLVFESIDEDLAVRLEALAPLSTVARGHTGIRAREGQKTIVSESKINSLYKRGIKSGGMVSPFIAGWDGTWLKVDPKLLFGGGFDPRVIENPKILMRQTADRIVAAYDDTGLYHLNNVHSFSCQRSGSEHGIDLHLLLGLMNSTLWHYLYRLKTREDGRALAQIDIETVETMPLPICEARLSKRIADLSVLLCQNHENVQNAVDQRAEIDQIVYQAYGLSSREIEHIERCLGVGYNSQLLKTGAV